MKNTLDRFTRFATFKDFVGELNVTYRRTIEPTVKIVCSQTVSDYMRPHFDQIMDDHEEVKVLHLNRNNQVVNVHHVTIGSDSACIVPIKDILRHCLFLKVSAICLIHNHPSSNLKPSKHDLDITEKLGKACQLIDIKLLDSIILTRESYYSLADNNQM